MRTGGAAPAAPARTARSTRFAINISRGSGFVFVIHDDGLPSETLANGVRALMKSPVADDFEFPVQASVIPWLRACARRNGIAIEPVGQ